MIEQRFTLDSPDTMDVTRTGDSSFPFEIRLGGPSTLSEGLRIDLGVRSVLTHSELGSLAHKIGEVMGEGVSFDPTTATLVSDGCEVRITEAVFKSMADVYGYRKEEV